MAPIENRLPFALTPFGKLSLELRQPIFEFVFEGPERSFGPTNLLAAAYDHLLGDQQRSSDRPQTLFIGNGVSPVPAQEILGNHVRSIIFTCRQLYIEASEIYAKKTQFYFSSVSALEQFSPFTKFWIQDLCITDKMIVCNHSCLRLLRVLSAMENLRVVSFSSRFCEHVFELSCPLRNLRGLQELRLRDSGRWRSFVQEWGPYYMCRLDTQEYRDKLQTEGQTLVAQVTMPKVKEPPPVPFGLPFSETCLGKLDTEIRMKIYTFVLAKEIKGKDPFKPDPRSLPHRVVYPRAPFMDNPKRPHHLPFSPRTRKPSPLAILLACRQICKEAYPVFYNINRLIFQTAKCLQTFLTAIGLARRQEVTDIVVLNKGATRTGGGFSLLLDCHKLRRLRIHAQRSTLKFWVKDQYLRSLRGLEKVEFRDLDDEQDSTGDSNYLYFFDLDPQRNMAPRYTRYAIRYDNTRGRWANSFREEVKSFEDEVTQPREVEVIEMLQ